METVTNGHQKIWIATILLFCGVSLGLSTPVTATVQIYPLGDSITYGDVHDGQNYPSYRYWLWNDLKNNGTDVDFIGSHHGPDYGLTFDTDNDGHAGYTTARELAELPTWLPGLHPDIVLLHMGTNDVLEGVPQATTIGNIGAIITELRAVNPNVKILLAQIIPTSVGSTNEKIVAFNTGLAGLQLQMNTDASPIILVDQYTGYNGEHDNQDGGVHPAESGEVKLADRWYAALIPLLSQVSVQPTVTATAVPAITVNPTTTQTTSFSGKSTDSFSTAGFGLRSNPFSGSSTTSQSGFSQVTVAGAASNWGSSSSSSQGWAPAGMSQFTQIFQRGSTPDGWTAMA